MTDTNAAHITGLDLLVDMPRRSSGPISPDLVQALDHALTEYQVRAVIEESCRGPRTDVVSLRLERGERIQRLRARVEDIALRVGAPSVRLSARTGQGTVALEIPRSDSDSVSLADVLLRDNSEPVVHGASLPWIVGVNDEGHPVIYDLAHAPHALISGTTGSGKSMALQVFVMGLMLTTSPDAVEVVLVDGKGTDVAPLETVPHVRRAPTRTPIEALEMLEWLLDEMRARYDVMAKVGAVNLDAYNRAKDEPLQRLVIVVDELADLLGTQQGPAIQSYLIRLAHTSRAAGMHLVLATQKPSASVLSTTLRSQLPARLCFRMSSASDSRLVLGDAGAEQLLGCGDGLLKRLGAETTRVQCVMVPEEWRDWLVWQVQHTVLGGARWLPGSLVFGKNERSEL